MHRSVRSLASLLGSFLVVASCTDAGRYPTGTAPADRSIYRSGVASSLLQLTAVDRATTLEHDVTWSFTAGPDGAVSRNDEVGLTIVIPEGALASTETITVTALAGAPVAYRFTPHLEFDSAVRLVQDLSHIRPSSWIGLVGAHFAGDQLQVSDGLVNVTEQVPAIISTLQGTLRFDVRHFSGWIVGSGNEGQPPDSSGSSGS